MKWVSQAGAAAVGTLMQPCLPVVTTLMAITLGFERSSTYKFCGIGVAIIGSILVVALGEMKASDARDSSESGGSQHKAADGFSAAETNRLLLQGTLTLLAQSFANASYILLQRSLLQPNADRPGRSPRALGSLQMSAFPLSLRPPPLGDTLPHCDPCTAKPWRQRE